MCHLTRSLLSRSMYRTLWLRLPGTARPRLTARHKNVMIDLNRPKVRHQARSRLAGFQGCGKGQHAVYGQAGALA